MNVKTDTGESGSAGKKTVSARLLYSGNNQYFQGHAEQENEIIISTLFGPRSTAKDIISGLLDDFNGNCSNPEAFDGTTDEDVERALAEAIDGDAMKSILKYVEVAKKRCPKCDKAGEVQSEDGGDTIDCDRCDGTGEIEDEEFDYDLHTIVLLSVDEDEDAGSST